MRLLHESEVEFCHKPNLAQWIESTILPPGVLISSCFGIIKHEGKYLLIKHISRGWEIPGGHLETGETAIQCFEREIMEEAGVSCKNIDIFAHQRIQILNTNKPENYKYPFPVSYQVVFSAEVDEIKNFEANLDSTERKFFTKEELIKDPFYPKYHFLFNF